MMEETTVILIGGPADGMRLPAAVNGEGNTAVFSSPSDKKLTPQIMEAIRESYGPITITTQSGRFHMMVFGDMSTVAALTRMAEVYAAVAGSHKTNKGALN